MEDRQDHNRIIQQAAREVLKPLGLFQRGRSRLWIDDNGWFLTLVEFQPSAWSKGSYLNVALHFLWGNRDFISYDYPIGGQTRQNSFVSFTGDETAFYEAVTAMAQKAAGLVGEYRKFRELSYARNAILEIRRNSPHDVLNKMMTCGLTKSPLTERCYLQLLTVSEAYHEQNPEIGYIARDLDYANSFNKVVHDPDLLQARVVGLINEHRDHLRTRLGYRRLSPEPFTVPALPPPPPEPSPQKVPRRRFLDHSDF